MWKNIFFESCVLSALIFGGFYINATLLKDELYSDEKKNSIHICGLATINNQESHISGEISEKKTPIHISGMITSGKITTQ